MDELLAWIYPNRVAIAVVTAAVAGVLVVVAWRRGWQRVARRHRRATMVVLILALAIAVPAGWYLGSPIFVRTELVEAAPASEASAAASVRARAGSFVGADDFHFARGTAHLVETAPGRWALRLEGFSVRNGPDLFVYLSPDPAGYADDALELGALKATDGSFNYEVPAGFDVDGVRSVVIWCKAFSVQFGSATLDG